MAAPKTWSNARKIFIQTLMTNKKIIFANINSDGIAQWDEECQDQDLIVCYYQKYSIYIICKAERHIGRNNSNFKGSLALFTNKNKISVGYKRDANTPFTKERFLVISENLIEEFCSHLNYYLDEYNPKK